MILIAQRANGPRYAQVVARLTRTGHNVVLAHSAAEAYEVIDTSEPDLVVLEKPDVGKCPDLLCGWIREANATPPKLLGLVHISDPDQRVRCEACMALLRPDAHPSLVSATITALLEEE